jgi:hypothetical protein
MDNINKPPTLLVPRLTRDYIRDGFKNLKHYTFYEPDVVLNMHYPDIILFALLAHVKQPNHILDLGSFFGLLPFAVEEVFRSSDNQQQFKWTLVDNCLYTKELAEAIKNNTGLSTRFLSKKHFDGWHQDNVPAWKEGMFFDKVGEYFLPPSTVAEFNGYWFKIANHHKIPRPYMQMFESMEEVKDKKFDLVHFDLTAGAYELNKNTFLSLVEHNLSDDGIIVFDDMRPQHPNMLLFFQYILANTDFRPIAFSTGKIAMMRKSHKEAFINAVVDNGLIEVDYRLKDSYFSFQRCGAGDTDWGNFLDLRTN